LKKNLSRTLGLSFFMLLKVAGTHVCVVFVRHFRSWKEGYQVEQWSTATVPVLYELPRGQGLRLPAVAHLWDNQSVPGEERITGARNVARKVNETFEVTLTSISSLTIIIAICLIYFDYFKSFYITKVYYEYYGLCV